MAGQFSYVYLLRSESNPDQVYTGVTSDLKPQLKDHNAGNEVGLQTKPVAVKS